MKSRKLWFGEKKKCAFSQGLDSIRRTRNAERGTQNEDSAKPQAPPRIPSAETSVCHKHCEALDGLLMGTSSRQSFQDLQGIQ